MRANEFIVEYKEYPTREYEGVTFTMKERDGQLIVKPLNDYGISMGHVVFNMDGKILDPQDLVIADKYQGQGIAKVMYDYIKSLGFTIERSWDQTPAGKGFWDKHRGEDVRVWEEVNPEVMSTKFHHEVEIGDYRYVADTERNKFYGNVLHITVFDGDEKIAQTSFKVDGDSLSAGSTVVWPKYRGQNIATNMYAYAKMLGNDIVPSNCQLDAGERMWRSWNQSKQSKHILPRGHKGYREH